MSSHSTLIQSYLARNPFVVQAGFAVPVGCTVVQYGIDWAVMGKMTINQTVTVALPFPFGKFRFRPRVTPKL